MLQSKLGRALLITLIGTCLTTLIFVGCGGNGNTDGGQGANDAGIGEQFVSDGGAGATLRIDVLGSLVTTGTVDFIVTLLDPTGAPIPFIRIFCESEAGIAILEPSRNGVAFESTAANGIMSGVLGGVTPGSYLLECRAEEGFNLIDRESIVITGDVPPGFDGFPGAAGGNLGGQLIIDRPEEDELGISAINFLDGPENTLILDSRQNGDCDNDPTTDDPEPFFFKNFTVTIANPFAEEAISVGTIRVSVREQGGATVTLPAQSFGIDIPVGGSSTIQGLFIDEFGSQYSGSGVAPTEGTHTATFTVTVTGVESGERFTLTDSQTFTYEDVNNC